MIADKIRQTADKICQGKVIAFDGSGYDPKGLLYPKGWLASICGLLAIDADLEEPYPLPSGHSLNLAIVETKAVVQAIRAKLARYWKCFVS